MTFGDVLYEIGTNAAILDGDTYFEEKIVMIPIPVSPGTDGDVKMSEMGLYDDEKYLVIMGGAAPSFDKMSALLKYREGEYEFLSVSRFYVAGKADHTECIVRLIGKEHV